MDFRLKHQKGVVLDFVAPDFASLPCQSLLEDVGFREGLKEADSMGGDGLTELEFRFKIEIQLYKGGASKEEPDN